MKNYFRRKLLALKLFAARMLKPRTPQALMYEVRLRDGDLMRQKFCESFAEALQWAQCMGTVWGDGMVTIWCDGQYVASRRYEGSRCTRKSKLHASMYQQARMHH